MLDKLKESFNQVVEYDQILNCIRLRRLYYKTKDTSLPTKERIELLLESLLVASAYEERLTSMKISCKSIRNKAKVLFEQKKNKIIEKEKNYYAKRKCDQTQIIASKTESVTLFLSELDHYIDIIDDALEYVRNAGFNIKSVLSTLKEFVESV